MEDWHFSDGSAEFAVVLLTQYISLLNRLNMEGRGTNVVQSCPFLFMPVLTKSKASTIDAAKPFRNLVFITFITEKSRTTVALETGRQKRASNNRVRQGNNRFPLIPLKEAT